MSKRGRPDPPKGEPSQKERSRPPKRTFSGDRLCFSLWLCRSLNFVALRLMTRLFQPDGLFDQVSGKKKRPAIKFWRPCCLATGSFSEEHMLRRIHDCSDSGLAADVSRPMAQTLPIWV
jgi:hypothetical protein